MTKHFRHPHEQEPDSEDVREEIEAELGREDESRRMEEHRADQAAFELGHDPEAFDDEIG